MQGKILKKEKVNLRTYAVECRLCNVRNVTNTLVNISRAPRKKDTPEK